jgi:hypothetical protein
VNHLRLIIIPLVLATIVAAQDRRVTPITVERKQALIIGNSKYRRAPLENPDNDATAMDATLRKLGFEVRTLRNLDLPRMDAVIDEFTSNLASGSFAFFYFSGHGIQVNYTNYLLPVDFAATSEGDVRWTAYPATRLQEKLESSGARLRLLVLDACRNNPFRFKRDALGGLAGMSANAEGTLIAFATGDNNTADDNQAESTGLYTKYLIQALVTPGLQLREAFQKAKEDVYQASHKTQNPSIYENLVGAYYLVSPPLGPAPAASGPAADVEAWMVAKDSGDVELLEQFLREFPHSEYGFAARAKLEVLRKPANKVPVVPKKQMDIEARVADVNGSVVTLAAGSRDGIQVGDRFEVFHILSPIKDPVTGEVLDSTVEKAGDLVITSVRDRIASGHYSGGPVSVKNFLARKVQKQ